MFLHNVETLPSSFGGELIDLDALAGEQSLRPAFDYELPMRLLPGQTMAFHNPWSSYSPRLSPNASARVQVVFSVTGESPKRGVQIDVNLGVADSHQ